MFASPLHNDPRLPELYTLYAKKQAHQARIRELRKKVQAELRFQKELVKAKGALDMVLATAAFMAG